MTVVLWVLAGYTAWTLVAFVSYVGLRTLIGRFIATDQPRYRLGLARRRAAARRGQGQRVRRAAVSRSTQRGVGS